MTGVHALPPWATRPVNLCPDCRRERRAGERHGMGDLDHEGEVVGVTCLDADGEVLLRPDPWPALDSEVAADPWSTHDPTSPPPF